MSEVSDGRLEGRRWMAAGLAMALAMAACSADGERAASERKEESAAPERPATAEDLARGGWRATLDAPGGPLTFGIEATSRTGGGLAAALVNGTEVRPPGAVTPVPGGLVIDIPPYRSRLVAEVRAGGKALVGRWERDLGQGYVTLMPFAAVHGEAREGVFRPLAEAVERVAGRWRVDFADDDADAVGLFEVDPDGRARGTFLTTLGDYRYLDGRLFEDTLQLACFDGAHAFLFRAEVQDDGSLAGDFWSRDSYHDTWTAVKDPSAELPDDFGLTTWSNATELGELRFLDLEGEERSLADPEFAGDARLLVVFGTWCPNCQDLTDALMDLRATRPGLTILGLGFELGDDPAAHARALRGYVRYDGIPWPVLVGGPADKAAASAALPVLDRVRAYPTTVFMDRNGNVSAVHTGFSGPATGDRHRLLLERFAAEIDALLDQS